MKTVSQPLALTVEMRPFFAEDKPEVYEQYMEEAFVGQGTFFNGKEFVAFADIRPYVFFYVGDGIIEQFNTRFNNFVNVTDDEIAEYCDSLNDSPNVKGYIYKVGTGFIDVDDQSGLEDAEVHLKVVGV
jgi:hypothetical protein